jgi:hypothetical protein
METKLQIQGSRHFNVYPDDRKEKLRFLSILNLPHIVFGLMKLNLNYERQCVMKRIWAIQKHIAEASLDWGNLRYQRSFRLYTKETVSLWLGLKTSIRKNIRLLAPWVYIRWNLRSRCMNTHSQLYRDLSEQHTTKGSHLLLQLYCNNALNPNAYTLVRQDRGQYSLLLSSSSNVYNIRN